MAFSISPRPASIRSTRCWRCCARRCRRSVAVALSRSGAWPEPVRIHLRARARLGAADTMVLLRSAMKQVARRHGHLVSFMCRPRLPSTFASGWHLHQSLLDRKTGRNLFVSTTRPNRSPRSAALSRGPAGACPRRSGVHHADDQRLQALSRHQLDGADPGHLGAGQSRRDDPRAGRARRTSTHLENRAGEPLANPYLYMASQIHAGLDGIARKLNPGRPRIRRTRSAEPLPKSLAEALAALEESACFREGFGDPFVDYHLHQELRSRGAMRNRGAVRQSIRGHSLGAQRVFRSGLMRVEYVARRRCCGGVSVPRKQDPRSCAILIHFCGEELRKIPLFQKHIWLTECISGLD